MSKDLEITITPAAAAQKPVLWRLLQLYLHDFSEFSGADDGHGLIREDGTFTYDHFDDFWTGDAKRRAFLFHCGDAPAGFALVNDWPASGEPVDRAVAEFFIARKYRRTGLGRRVALSLVHMYPGTWEVAVAGYNTPAIAFWNSILTPNTVGELRCFEGDGKRWWGPIFRFSSP